MRIPLYIRFVFFALAIIIFFYALVVADFILMPLALAFLIAILLLPMSRFFENLGVARILSVSFSILLVIVVLSLLSFGIGMLVSNLAKDITQIDEKLFEVVNRVQSFFQERLNMEPQSKSDYIKDSIGSIVQQGSDFFTGTLSATASVFTFAVILLLSVFFFLYYRDFFREFFYKIFPESLHGKISNLLLETKRAVTGYISGLLLMMLTVGTLNGLGLWILGVDYALLWGALSGLLAAIPYIGVTIGGILPMLYTLVAMDSLLYPLGVIGVFGFVQFLEGNFITPNIMSSRVSLNPFAVIIAIFIGESVWGIGGIILFIPYLAILKNVLDEFETTKPFGFLLGNPHESDEGNNSLLERFKNKIGLGKGE
ncbi:AI-2E family transporter [Salegentibacter sp. LM13S]|uniref:AI-2E family transporter n=1 Tax=Salegentibacter lacus TaxID=2873599 RepID=UPI001CCC3298|nr:AI-2E family transporter [Salegentibacter lacus]MBZ9630860.1 AI-2E family transporter [Salegentibacter lacus]